MTAWNLNAPIAQTHFCKARSGLLTRRTSSVHRTRWACPLGGLLLALATLAAVAADAKRVLVVHSFVNAAPPFTTHSTAFETTLTAEMGERIDLDEVSLDVARYATLDMEEALVEFIRKRQDKWRPDLVVPIGSPAGVFVAQHRDRLFPTAPVLYAGMDRRRLPSQALERNAAFVGESFDIPEMVEEMLRLAPATTNIAVVIGASQLEQYWASAIQREWMPFTNRVSFTWLNELSYDQMLARVSVLPPRSFIFLVLLMRDATGVTHNADEAQRQIHTVANAPVNSIFRHQLGLGIVGGRLYQAELEGVEAARIAIRILRGEPATNFQPRIIGPLEPAYDERELKRWNISESRLPPGSMILFREPALWQRYYGRILLVISALLVQAVIIFLLLVNRARRRRAEQTAREFGGRLLHAQEAERARLARELHDDITQRLALLAIDAARVERAAAGNGIGDTMRGVREGLVRLSEDVHTLSYRLHSSLLDDLGLAEALKVECEQFARQESIPCDVRLQNLPEAVPHDTALGLFRVTQEALRNIARHAQARAVDVTLRSLDDGLQLAVRDDGIGFDAAHKPNRTSLGLSSMSERVRLLDGELDIESAPGHGTTIVAWVPLNGKEP